MFYFMNGEVKIWKYHRLFKLLCFLHQIFAAISRLARCKFVGHEILHNSSWQAAHVDTSILIQKPTSCFCHDNSTNIKTSLVSGNALFGVKRWVTICIAYHRMTHFKNSWFSVFSHLPTFIVMYRLHYNPSLYPCSACFLLRGVTI